MVDAMKNIRFSVLLIFIVAAHTGNCLHCYICSSKRNEGCLDPVKNKLPTAKCNMKTLNDTKHLANDIDESFMRHFEVEIVSQDPMLPLNCLKQITKVGDKEIVIRGCQLAPTEQMDICTKVSSHKKDNIKVNFCMLCDAEECNSSPKTGNVPFPATLIMLTVGMMMRKF